MFPSLDEVKENYLKSLFNCQRVEYLAAPFTASNDIFKVKLNEHTCLVKCFATDRLYTGNRQQQFYLQLELASQGIAPMPIAYDVQLKLWVEQWLDAESLEGLTRDLAIKYLANNLYRIHSLQPAKQTMISLTANWRRYQQLLQGSQFWLEIPTKLLDIIQQDSDLCFCHNDLALAHVLQQGKGVLLDWEYAGRGHRAFDLASCIKLNALQPAEIALFLHEYTALSKMQLSYITEKAQLMAPVVDFTYQLWHNAFSRLKQ